MRSVSDPVMVLFFVYPWVLGFALSYVYIKVQKALSGNKGLNFGILAWLAAGLPSAFMVFASMNYPLGFTVNSLIGSLLYFIAGGIIIARFSESK